jgi:hypothetical protein
MTNSELSTTQLLTSLSSSPLLSSPLLPFSLLSYPILSSSSFSLTSISNWQSWVGPFLMSAVMANCVRRSNAIIGYSAKFTYRESVVYASFFAGEFPHANEQILIYSLLCTSDKPHTLVLCAVERGSFPPVLIPSSCSLQVLRALFRTSNSQYLLFNVFRCQYFDQLDVLRDCSLLPSLEVAAGHLRAPRPWTGPFRGHHGHR